MGALEIRVMEAGELDDVIGLWLRSLAEVLAGLRPEQRRSLDEYRESFRTRVAPRCDLWVAVRGAQLLGFVALSDGELAELYVDPPA